MKVLLLGEYSNMHWTLAQGLRELGCNVTVVSNGDGFKNYKRDIDLRRKGFTLYPTIEYLCSIYKNFKQFKGFDFVQIVNPCFLDVKPKRNLELFYYLKKHNSKVFLGAFGNDYYWVKTCIEKKTFRYSEFDIPKRKELLDEASKLLSEWTNSEREFVNKKMAEQADGIIACLYEYYESYKQNFAQKLSYIPEPINLNEQKFKQRGVDANIIRFFIGIQTQRNLIKGTDIMQSALQAIHAQYPNNTSISIAKSVSHTAYRTLRGEADVLLDQLYSYTPGMNALEAMAQGLVVVGGGEPEMYELQGEYMNRPIVNVYPTVESVFEGLESLVVQSHTLAKRSFNSRLFVEKHHDHIAVAKQYLDFWKS